MIVKIVRDCALNGRSFADGEIVEVTNSTAGYLIRRGMAVHTDVETVGPDDGDSETGQGDGEGAGSPGIEETQQTGQGQGDGDGEGQDNQETSPCFEEMAVAELREYAEQTGIELPKGGKKAELLTVILDAVESALAAKAQVKAEEGDGDEQSN